MNNRTEFIQRGDSLHYRELEILQLIAHGKTNDQISKHLFIGIDTVKTYINSLYVKLAAHNKVQATVFAIRYGLLPCPCPFHESKVNAHVR